MKKPEQTQYVPQHKTQYSIGDVIRLDKEINGGFRTAKAYDDYMIKAGALNAKGEIKDVSVYEEVKNKLNQWHNWKANQQYAEKKKVEGLEQVAAGMTVKDEWNW
jgi:hypothetical protein